MERFDFEVDQLHSVKVHLVIDVVNSSDVGSDLRKTYTYVRKQKIHPQQTSPVSDLLVARWSGELIKLTAT